MDGETGDLATRLGQLAVDLVLERDGSDVLERVVRAAVELVGGAERAAVDLVVDLDRAPAYVVASPALSPGEPGAAAGSVLSLPLLVGTHELGALTLYARAPGAFDADSRRVGALVAVQAAVAVAGRARQDQLARALASRGVIGQACGILMERHRFSADEAFTRLVAASQSRNHKLRDVAADLVDSGEWTGPT